MLASPCRAAGDCVKFLMDKFEIDLVSLQASSFVACKSSSRHCVILCRQLFRHVTALTTEPIFHLLGIEMGSLPLTCHV